MINSHWASKYIGEPWIAHENDCWAFCRRIWAEHYNLLVPIIDVDATKLINIAHAFKDNDERKLWSQVLKPTDGDAVLMAHCRHPSHIGIWIDTDLGGILHCMKGPGVVFTSMMSAKLAGWGRLEFYRRGIES